AAVHGDRAWLGILGALSPGGHDLHVGACGWDARGGSAKDAPMPLHFLLAASGEEAERGPAGVEADRAARVHARRGRRPVFQRMPDERRGNAALAKELLLERQDDRELVHRREFAHALWPPRP